MKPDPFAIREADPTRDAESVLAVWRSSLGDPERAAGKYRWFYLDAPGGRNVDVGLIGLFRFGLRGGRIGGRCDVLLGGDQRPCHHTDHQCQPFPPAMRRHRP